MTTLTIDDREPRALREAIIEFVGSDHCEVRRLTFGDYAFRDQDGHHIAIERKAISDFLASMTADKLQRQLTNLAHYDAGILLLEGCWGISESGKVVVNARESQWSAMAMQMAVMRYQRAMPWLMTLHTSSEAETIRLMKQLTNRSLSQCTLSGVRSNSREVRGLSPLNNE